MDKILEYLTTTGFYNLTLPQAIMIAFGLIFIYLAIRKNFEPLLLLPIGFGIIMANIPGASIDPRGPVYDEGSVMYYLYFGVKEGIYPPLIFMGLGAMTDFSALISNPRLMLLGAAAQLGVFGTFLGALALGMTPQQAGSVGIIGGADGPTAIFLSSQLAPELIGAIAIAAYSYMALVPVIQPPIMRLLTSKSERLIKMKPPRAVSRNEKIIFAVMGFIVCSFIAPKGLPLFGMFFAGNLLKESGVTDRLARTASNSLVDIATILVGLMVGTATSAARFLTFESIKIFILGAIAFSIATAGGIIFAKIMNMFSKNKINPLIGAAGVSAVPTAARVVHQVGQSEDPTNFLLHHAMGSNVAGVIGSAIAAGVLWSILG